MKKAFLHPLCTLNVRKMLYKVSIRIYEYETTERKIERETGGHYRIAKSYRQRAPCVYRKEVFY